MPTSTNIVRVDSSLPSPPPKHAGGQPLLIPSPQIMIDLLDKYLIYCKKTKEVANKAGFCHFCGVSHEAFADYKKRSIFEHAIALVENALQNTHIQRGSAMDIFILKNHYGYRDQSSSPSLTINVNLGGQVSSLQAADAIDIPTDDAAKMSSDEA